MRIAPILPQNSTITFKGSGILEKPPSQPEILIMEGEGIYPKNLTSFATTYMPAAQYLPFDVRKSRFDSIYEAVTYITGDEFKNKINAKNWKDEKYKEQMFDLMDDESFLFRRAGTLLTRAKSRLEDAYKNQQKIIIPFSGGRDSSALLALTLAFFPEKEVTLVTALNGFAEGIENPVIQKKYLENLFHRPEVPHVFLDATEDIEEFALNSAQKDKECLGSCAICSVCKIVMEKHLANYAKLNGCDRILMGYSNYQGMQDWVEQTPQQIKFMQAELLKHGVRTLSPLYDVLEYPFDSILLLASLGIPLKHHKNEMKCQAGGLNPENLDLGRLEEFLVAKNKETQRCLERPPKALDYGETEKTPVLIDRVTMLREDRKFVDGVFREKKFEGQYGEINS